jgi:hypothetical protein
LAIDILFLAVGALAIAAGVWRAVRARRSGAGVGPAISLIALGAALCFLADGSQAFESRLYPSLGRLLSNLATMVAAYGIEVTVAEISGARGRGRRTRLVALGAALIVLAATFFATSGLPTGLGLFDELYRTHPTLVVYVVAYTCYLGFAVVDIAVVSAGTIRASGGALRTGLALLIGACVFALAYLVGKVVSTLHDLRIAHPVALTCHGAFSTVGCALDVGFPAVSVLLIVLGLSIPAFPAARRALRDSRTRRALEPLRARLIHRFPDVVRLDAAGTTTRERLLTAMSETNDGLILAGVSPSMAADVAARLAYAAPDSPIEHESVVAEAPGEAAFAADVTRLRAIAEAYRRLTRTQRSAGAPSPAR